MCQISFSTLYYYYHHFTREETEHREVNVPTVTLIVSRGTGKLAGNDMAPNFVFLVTCISMIPLIQLSLQLPPLPPRGPQEAWCACVGSCITTLSLLGPHKSWYSAGPCIHGELWKSTAAPPWGLLWRFSSLKNEACVLPNIPMVFMLYHCWFSAWVQEEHRTSSWTHEHLIFVSAHAWSDLILRGFISWV